MTSILTLADDEIESLLAGDPLDIRCDSCGATYVITPDELRRFRASRSRS